MSTSIPDHNQFKNESQHSQAEAEPPQNADIIDEGYLNAVKNEVLHEISHIEHPEEPFDSKQSDVLVRKHINGLVVTLFGLVVVLLAVGIYAITVFGHHLK